MKMYKIIDECKNIHRCLHTYENTYMNIWHIDIYTYRNKCTIPPLIYTPV